MNVCKCHSCTEFLTANNIKFLYAPRDLERPQEDFIRYEFCTSCYGKLPGKVVLRSVLIMDHFYIFRKDNKDIYTNWQNEGF